MRLNKLVGYKQICKSVDVTKLSLTVASSLAQLEDDLNNAAIDFNDAKYKINKIIGDITSNFEHLKNELDLYKQSLDSLINSKADPVCYVNSLKIFDELNFGPADAILERSKEYQLFADPEITNFFLSRISNYVNFKYPALEIRPLFGKISESLVGFDPLYLADNDSSLFKETQYLWNPLYQNRLRYYVYNEQDLSGLSRLPQNQIGLIVVSEKFNYVPVEKLDEYLKEFWKLLCPGGTVIFTFNNCDFAECVKKHEYNLATYVPSRKVKDICNAIGYNINYEFTFQSTVSWIEISKPGELISLRAGQTLGKIENI